MSETAEAVAADVEARRSITIEITNQTQNYCLVNPRVFLDNGSVYSPPQPTVRPLKTEVCVFTKDRGKSTGAVGVLAYDLFERQGNAVAERVAMMFSVPWDYNLYKNWFAVGLYQTGRECDEGLFKEMYYDKTQSSFHREEANGSGINFEGQRLDIRATMCPMGKAIMKLEVWDRVFSPQMSQRPY